MSAGKTAFEARTRESIVIELLYMFRFLRRPIKLHKLICK